ncbi:MULTISPECIES: polysaccharide biosynthesis protein [Vagococcus]|uniref:putative polysaccharide biosynthesis protein n=1 Tax=Vagococcus TaxID=2737 RepID=UPI000EBA7DF6|nr:MULTISPECIES: polysaccharide biosynthesis protein [Vagococcus]MDT2807236.1 polysaccharide biosynthesis protein [Vagococcus lutrae]HCT95659.1 polysaccharide biosynthesis protein [Vagococcus sp.]
MNKPQNSVAETKTLNSQEKMVRGSIWMTIGSFVSRLLGAAYIIPWYIWMGEHAKVANNLFTKGYNIYALFLMISTAGIPAAIAKQISHYNSLNEYQISKRLFKRALTMMAIFGVVCASVMYFGAPILAGGNEKLIPTMRSLSIAILIFPVMSTLRGFFQGNHDMMPSALSQIVEQIARVIYMLVATYTIMQVMKGDYVKAVTHSTFAAFIGALAALGLLSWFYFRYNKTFKILEAQSANQVEVPQNELMLNIIKEAIPFIIIGSAITFFKIFDQYTFEPILKSLTNFSDVQVGELFTLFSANPDKLTMITISLATSIAVTSLPLVTEAFTVKDRVGLAKLVSDNIQLFFFVMLPSTFGMIVLAYPLNTMFYEADALGTSLLVEAALVGIVLGFYIITSTTLQGLYGNQIAIRILGVGFLIKVLLQYPAIWLFESYGPLLATGIAFLIAALLNVREIYHLTQFDRGLTARRTLLIFIITLVMTLVAWLTRQGLYLLLSPTRKFQAFLIILLVAVIGIALYGYITLKIRLADKLLGPKVAKLRTRFHIN